MKRHLFVIALLCIACSATPTPPVMPVVVAPEARVDPRCALTDEPQVIAREGAAILLRWEQPLEPSWSEPILPPDKPLADYRQAFVDAGTAVRYPVADLPAMNDDALREVWRREYSNQALAYSGDAGEVRAMTCLEGLLFAWQAARFSQLSQPTEFIATALRRDVDGQTLVRLYFSASDQMFPPKKLYGFDEVAGDRAAGWTVWFVLHNHTVQTLEGAPALGVPAPSSSDVQLSLGLRERFDVESIRVTNGFYTVDIPAAALDVYQTPP